MHIWCPFLHSTYFYFILFYFYFIFIFIFIYFLPNRRNFCDGFCFIDTTLIFRTFSATTQTNSFLFTNLFLGSILAILTERINCKNKIKIRLLFLFFLYFLFLLFLLFIIYFFYIYFIFIIFIIFIIYYLFYFIFIYLFIYLFLN